MKNLKNETFKLRVNVRYPDGRIEVQEIEETTVSLAEKCIDHCPQGGFPLSTQRKRNRIADVLEKGGDELVFEDSDFAELVKCIEEMPWSIRDKEIQRFSETVVNLK
jgi:uncharacterized protein YbbK (DUF523 family)